ncbi:MAG: hypothetical protein LBL07_07955 [Tannerella sp.]|jgi:hypothetical protein|nr:hypothetical protein [Tannerella sp.]
MKTDIKNQNSKIRVTLVMLVLFAVLAVSCSEIYDNIAEYVTSEKVYSDKLDGVIRVQIGFERVEIDLMEAGRIPSSQIHMGKAKKTVIECADFTEPDHRRVIDSVCSWVNITGLTQQKLYKFTLYTEDEFGNRSKPITAEAKPYTSENRDALELPPPGITESTSAVLLEWQDPLSSKSYNFFRYRYEYTDRDGIVHDGDGDGDMPSFFVENVALGQNINIRMTCRVVPKLPDGTGRDVPILDTLDWQTQLRVSISSDALPAIFLKTPASATVLGVAEDGAFPQTFSWTDVPEAGGDYILKISKDAAFPEDGTLSIAVGDKTEYELDRETGASFLTRFKPFHGGRLTLYWTIIPTTPSASIRTQARQFAVMRPQPAVAGRWLFDDPDNMVKATVGQNLVRFGSDFTFVEGPAANNLAIRVGKGSYFRCIHDLAAGDGNKVNEYTIMFYVSYPQAGWHALMQTNLVNSDDADYFINASGNIGVGDTGYSSIRFPSGQWGRITLSFSAGLAANSFLDGEPIRVSVGGSRFALDPAGVLFFADEDGEDNIIDVAEIVLWGTGLDEYEVSKYLSENE